MGTRSLTHVHDDRGEVFFTFYKQHDGYPEGWGEELAEFLAGFRVVNGLSGDKGKIANGMECLAAQIIAHFKDEPGQFYIYKADSKDCGEEYVYHVHEGAEVSLDGRFPRKAKAGRLVCAEAGGAVLFDGDPATFPAFLKELEAKRES